jgi:tetratricopeptide (TPR) repeat protein
MLLKALSITVCLIALAGCAAAPRAALPEHFPWRDQAFDYDAALVPVGKQDLFQLDATLRSALHDPVIQRSSAQARLNHLIALLFGPEARDFPYAQGHSTIAAETWRLKRGDCLSLTVLAYSLAKDLGLSAKMQDVRVPVVFDRRGRIDFLNRHVNVIVKDEGSLQLSYGSMSSGDIIIDFEPQIGSRRKGKALSEDGIVARFYNNVAAENLAQGNQILAYAYFKAAILADPAYSPSYSNLAQLYMRRGFLESAEQLLIHAIALDDDADIAMHSLHQLLATQGREIEALKYAKMLQARQDEDPYYWLGLGLEFLRRENFREAIDALERAQNLTTGFEEVHRYLAVAYWRAGKQSQAKKQLAVLASMPHDGSGFDALIRKINMTPRD